MGEGGFGEVYQAYEPDVKRVVALKVLAKANINISKLDKERFLQEIYIVRSLDHPSIVPIHSFGETPEYLYYAMRVMPNGSLADLLKILSVQEIAQELIGVNLLWNFCPMSGLI